MRIRQRIYEVIEAAEQDDRLSRIYDIFMMVIILLSLFPLTIKGKNEYAVWIDRVATWIFIIDYLLRLFTADLKLNKKAASFFLYPFTPMALIDLISILPSITVMNNVFRVFKMLRLGRTFRVFRILKLVRYSKSITMILNVFRKQRESLLVVGGLAVAYIFVSALIVFNVEPDTFSTFFDALYWATVSLTTVGYGDIYTVSQAGKIITMISAIFGIAIVALPAGILTAGYEEELYEERERKRMGLKKHRNRKRSMYVIDVSDVSQPEELHEIVAQDMQLPDYYGNNLDALYDVLTGWGEPCEIFFRYTKKMEAKLPDYTARLRRMCQEAMEENENIQIVFE